MGTWTYPLPQRQKEKEHVGRLSKFGLSFANISDPRPIFTFWLVKSKSG